MMKIDRDNRDRLIEAIKQFLNEEIMAFEFADKTFGVRGDSDDSVILYVVDELWHFYDDCKDHKVALAKVEWDYINRLMLLLESDAQITVEKSTKWRFSQLFAVVGLFFFCLCVALSGFGEHLFIVTVPLGVLSIVIARIRDKSEPVLSKKELALMPFKSRAEIFALLRELPDFKKMKHTGSLENRPIRSPFFEKFHYCLWKLICLILSPVILLFQSFPRRKKVISIIIPA
jgi:hypothetical protein